MTHILQLILINDFFLLVDQWYFRYSIFKASEVLWILLDFCCWNGELFLNNIFNRKRPTYFSGNV